MIDPSLPANLRIGGAGHVNVDAAILGLSQTIPDFGDGRIGLPSLLIHEQIFLLHIQLLQ